MRRGAGSAVDRSLSGSAGHRYFPGPAFGLQGSLSVPGVHRFYASTGGVAEAVNLTDWRPAHRVRES
jgi:hypothetical protein